MSRRAAAWGLGVAVLLVWELAARAFPPPDPRAPAGRPAAGTITLEGDPWLLWQLRPGDREEHGKPVHVDAAGFRDRHDGPVAHPRILTVGDSSVYGFGVSDDEVFSARLERTLAARVPGAQVINGATPGWSTFQTLNMLDMRGWALEPDLLVIGNLWSDNNFDDFVDRELLASYAGFRQTPDYRLRVWASRSALFRWLDYGLRVAPRGREAARVGWSMGGDGPRSGRRRVAINDYADNLDTLCARMRERGGGVVFLLLANREDVNPRSADPAWGPYRQVMREAAERNGVPLVDIPEVMRASGRSEDTLFLDQMHPTADGHARMAAAVDAALTAAGWPDQRLIPRVPAPHPRYTDRFEDHGIDQHGAQGAAPAGSPAAGEAAGVPAPGDPAGASGPDVGLGATTGLTVDVDVPDYTRGDLLLAVLGVDGTPLATATLPGPGVARVGAVHTSRVRLRLTIDVDRDGATAGDAVRELGPLDIGGGGVVPARFSVDGR